MDPHISLQGIPFDEKSSFMKGASKAPPVIRQAYRSDSSNFSTEDGHEFTPDMLFDTGDIQVDDYFDIEKKTLSTLSSKLPLISLGGDHSITFPVLKAFNKVYGPLDVLHIDAHSDLYDNYGNDPFSHACTFARILEEGLATRLVQVGIRTLNQHQLEQAERFGVSIIHMKSLGQMPALRFQNPLYISVDLDALDPAFAPGVSHLEPGGMTTRELLEIIQAVNCPVIGADIVEFNPDRDINGLTAMVCAKLLKEIAIKIMLNHR